MPTWFDEMGWSGSKCLSYSIEKIMQIHADYKSEDCTGFVFQLTSYKRGYWNNLFADKKMFSDLFGKPVRNQKWLKHCPPKEHKCPEVITPKQISSLTTISPRHVLWWKTRFSLICLKRFRFESSFFSQTFYSLPSLVSKSVLSDISFH